MRKYKFSFQKIDEDQKITFSHQIDATFWRHHVILQVLIRAIGNKVLAKKVPLFKFCPFCPKIFRRPFFQYIILLNRLLFSFKYELRKN